MVVIKIIMYFYTLSGVPRDVFVAGVDWGEGEGLLISNPSPASER